MKVFITREIPEIAYSKMREAGLEITVHSGEPLGQEALITACQQTDALLSAGFNRLDAYFFKQCPGLKVIALFSVGYDSVDLAAATAAGVPVGNTPEVLSGATADTAFLLMLATSRKAFYNYRKILDGKWQNFEPIADLGQELNNKTLGIYGLGKIGLEMARKCKGAFNMEIVYHNRHRNPEAEADLGARYLSFEQLLGQSDVLSVHANLTEENRGVFNRDAFRKMKPNAIFVNTGRGGLHQETDLKEALEQGIIWGAGLDVTNPEPMDPANPLLLMPNVSVLPHIGSATRESRNGMARLAADNIIAGLKGEKLPTILNSEVYQKPSANK
ncbi:D-glycerate dehydrogenase [Niabella terrae]